MKDVLVDLDGTLFVQNIFPTQAQAMCGALERVLGVNGARRAPIDWAGKTDRQVAANIAAFYGVKPPAWDALSAEWEWEYKRQFFRDCASDLSGHVRPHARDLLRAIQRPRVVSGNLRAVGTAKLVRAGLADLIDLRASIFNQDALLRMDLVRVADQHRKAPALIGDTPRDVEAGVARGIPVVALSSIHHDRPSLGEAGAAVVVEDLREAIEALPHLDARRVV